MPPAQLRLLVVLPVVAVLLIVVGLTSGYSTNTESEPIAGQAVTSVACGSPWAPDYADAQRFDELRHLGSGLVDACRTHNEAEALLADATTPAGVVLLLTMFGVTAAEVRYHRRRTTSSGVSVGG